MGLLTFFPFFALLDDLIKSKKTEAKKAKAKTAKKAAPKVAAKKKPAVGGKTKAKKSAKGGKMDVETSKVKKEAKSKAAAKIKRGNLMAAKRGMAPKLDTAAIQKTIQAEAKKLAVRMVAATQGSKGGKGGKGKGAGNKKGKAVKISFRTADLKKTTDKNMARQLQGMLAKSPKTKGGSNKKQGGASRRIVLK